MFFALLLVNVFVIKEMHYAFEHDHDHAHELIDRHADCSTDTHFHSYQFVADCNICDFNFSPTELFNTDPFFLNPRISESTASFYQRQLITTFRGTLPAPRGPPVSMI